MNIQKNQAVQQAAADMQYFKDWDNAKFTQAAFELAKMFPEHPAGEWLLVLKGLRDSGVISEPSSPVAAPPAYSFPEIAEEKTTNYLPYIVGGFLLLAFLAWSQQ